MYRACDMKKQKWISDLCIRKQDAKRWITKYRNYFRKRANYERQLIDPNIDDPVRFVICKVEVRLIVQDKVEVYDPKKNVYELTEMAKTLYAGRQSES